MATKITLRLSDRLPLPLKSAIDALGLSKILTNHCYHMVALIAKRSRHRYGIDTCYHPLPVAYLRTRFTTKFADIINPLREANILHCNDSYSPDLHFCKQYRVNPELYNTTEDYVPMAYKYKVPKEWSLELDDVDVDAVSEPMKRVVMQNHYQTEHEMTVKQLKIDKKGLYKIVEDKLALTEDVEKRQNIQKHWLSSVDNLANGYLFARRNKSNFRLDSNFTNLAKPLRDKIVADNDMITFDLVNSQFVVLGAILKALKVEGEDVEHFCNLVANGKFYEYIEQVKGLEDRRAAKRMMFEVNFGRHYIQTPNKEMFRELFPSVNNWIAKQKYEKGYQEIALMLQRREANIFIDGIKKELMNAGILHFTVHDSVTCKVADAGVVYEIIKEKLGEAGLEGYINLEGDNAQKTIDLHNLPVGNEEYNHKIEI